MKLKWKLLPLAFAAAGFVGCTDEIEGGSVSENGELVGETAYMKISVNTSTVTKAIDDPTGGEDGDDMEVGSDEESSIKDVTVILYEGTGTSTLDYTNLSDKNLIVGAGYATNLDMTSGTIKDHNWAATVKVVIKDKGAAWDGKTYGVLAVTNLGSDNEIYKGITGEDPTINNVNDLADKLQKVYKTKEGFVMSTHSVGGGNSGLAPSVITLDAGADEDHAPSVNVYVERLAAKVRINVATNGTEIGTDGGHIGNYVYAPTKSPNDRVVLQHAAVINQLKSGSYTLKRVTKSTETLQISDNKVLLGDETLFTVGEKNGLPNNYVIDPWTDQKNIPFNSNVSGLEYFNRFSNTDYASLWGITITGSENNAEYKAVPLNNNNQGNTSLTLCYTMENTVAADNALKGYVTGVLFQALYFPEKWTAVVDNDETEAVNIDYNDTEDGIQGPSTVVTSESVGASKTFYVSKSQAIVYKDYEAVLAGYLNEVLSNPKNENDLTISDFSDSKIENLTVKKFIASAASKVSDPFGYIDYLNARALELGENASFGDNDSFSDYQNLTDKFDKSDFITYYGGVCYYDYWLKHAENGKNADMGVMEYAIVRNNIYDMTVTDIKELGLGGSEVPDPENPVESKDIKMTVNIHVKDWVVRKNDGIIL